MSQETLDKEQNNNTEPAAGTDAEASAIEAALNEAAKFRDLALRGQAEFDNYRKRSQREREDAVKYANFKLLERLLPLLDNYELGLEAAKKDSAATAILTGFEMVSKQFQDFLAASGVEVVKAEGTAFDPNQHEAIGQETSDEVAEGQVLRQLRKGFRLSDRLLRPALVVVSKGRA